MISAVANMFDKHVFHWLRMTWEQFEQTKEILFCSLACEEQTAQH